MKQLKDFTFGIVGLGLMGGSIGKAIRENILNREGAEGRIFGADINPVSLDMAREQHIADRTFTMDGMKEMLSECDFTFICLYPRATLEFLIANRDFFKSGSIVTDISGVKAEIFARMDEIFRDDVDFIPGHPMAGREKEGYAHSDGSIFKNHNYIIMPLESNKKENVEIFKELISSIEFSRIVETTAQIHDHKIAYTSQLSHVIASALVSSAEDTRITEFGGGSFEDLTRIAMINSPLWTELFISNRTELVNCITNFEKSIATLKDFIQNKDAKSIEEYLDDVRSKRMAMSRIETKLN